MPDYLADYRTKLRRSLKDEDAAAYRWTNDVLDRHIARSVTEYSNASPREQKATIATTLSSRNIDIAALTNIVKIALVEFPVGSFPPTYQPFSVYMTTLTLLGDYTGTGGNAYVYWGTLHTLSAGTNTIPGKDEEVILLGAQAYALIEYAAYAIDRVHVGGTYTPKDYRTWGEKLSDRFEKELKRLKSRVRVTRGYAPYYPIESQSRDYGP